MEKKQEVEQLDMGLKEPKSNRFRHLKYRIEIFFTRLRTNSLFTAPFLWISCAFAFSFILVQNYYYTSYIGQLPREIPLFAIAKTPELRLADREILLFIIIFSIFLTLISFLISTKMYYKFRLVSLFIMVNLTFTLLLITISYIRIFSAYIF